MSPLSQLLLNLQLVETSLLLATNSKPTLVHELRVNTRRALAALSTFGESLDPNETQWMTKQLHRIRRAAGNARDLDVLKQRYKKGARARRRMLLQHIKLQRRDSHGPIVKLQKQLIISGKFQNHVVRLMDLTVSDAESSESTTDSMMRARLETATSKFFETARIANSNVDAKTLHRMRLQTKELRYVLEFCDPILSADVRANIYPIMVKLQERLGNINDRASACRRLARWRKAEASNKKAKVFRKQWTIEKAQLQKLTRQFKTWWTADIVDQLEKSFRKLDEREVRPTMAGAAVDNS